MSDQTTKRKAILRVYSDGRCALVSVFTDEALLFGDYQVSIEISEKKDYPNITLGTSLGDLLTQDVKDCWEGLASALDQDTITLMSRHREAIRGREKTKELRQRLELRLKERLRDQYYTIGLSGIALQIVAELEVANKNKLDTWEDVIKMKRKVLEMCGRALSEEDE